MSESKTLSQSERAAAYVKQMDAAIEGSNGDKQTFKVACKLVEFGLDYSEAMSILSDYNQRCQPPWTEKGLIRKLRCAFRKAAPNKKFTDDTDIKRPIPQVEGASKWPKPLIEVRQRIVAAGGGLADLQDLSPIRFELPSTLEIIKILFPGDPLICVGKSSREFWTDHVSFFHRRLEYMQFIVPSPMSARTGKIQDPEPDGPIESAHTKDNTGPRKFAVVEFDEGTYDEHSAILWHLSDYAPLIMVLHSGGKSIHGWFHVEGEDEQDVMSFYRYAVALGGDYHTHLKSQFVRMPDARRDNGKRQTVYYFNPGAIG